MHRRNAYTKKAFNTAIDIKPSVEIICDELLRNTLQVFSMVSELEIWKEP